MGMMAHPKKNNLRRFLRDVGTAEEIAAIDAHVETCGVCQSLLDELKSEDMTPPELDRYEVSDLIGKGGMSEVWMARDKQLRRDVAIKALRWEHKNNPDVRRRFDEEACITSQPQHPGIAPVQ